VHIREEDDGQGEVEQGLSEADLRLLQVDRKMAETEMEMARETLSSLEAKAPLGGVVLYRRSWTVLEVGSEVWPTQPLMDIADMHNEVRFPLIHARAHLLTDAPLGGCINAAVAKDQK